MPSASVPPSTGRPGLWRRKSGVGAVDAQGNLLAHPMVKRRDEVHYRMVLISRSIRRGWTSVSSDGPNPPIGEQALGQAPLEAKKSVGPPLQIYLRMRRWLIMITFSDTCRSMREQLMVITESEVGKILTLICRSCACRRLEKVGDLIFSLSSCRTWRRYRRYARKYRNPPKSTGRG